MSRQSNKNSQTLPKRLFGYFLSQVTIFFQYPKILSTLLLLGASLLISFILFPRLIIAPKEYKLGDIAQSDIKAERDFLVEDTIATERYRQEAMAKVPPIYNFKEGVWQDLKSRIAQAFELMRRLIEENKIRELAQTVVKNKKGALKIYSDKDLKKKFEQILPLHLTISDFETLKKEKFSPRTEELLYQILEPLYMRGIVEDKTPLVKSKYGIVLIYDNSLRRQRIFNLDRILSLEEARQEIKQQRYMLYNEINKGTAQVILKMAMRLLKPNVYFNFLETQRAKEEAVKKVKPVFYQVKKGEMIVREGERIDQMQLVKLKAQQKQMSRKDSALLFFALNGLILILLGTTQVVTRWLNPVFLRSQSNFIFWLSNVLFFSVLARVGLEVASLFAQNFSCFSSSAFVYPLPVNGATMLLTLFTQPQLGFALAPLMAALAGVMAKSPSFFVYFLVGGMWVAFQLRSCRHRSKLIRVGLELGLIQAALAFCMAIMHQDTHFSQGIIDMGLSLLGGMASGIVVLGLTPIVEIIFGYTSDIRLLELANLDQPLLKELMVKAPGTYHHSVIVAQLVEAAAEEIGANPLLGKVAGYYHDIGKLKKPLYFIENQIGIENRHERLNPSMSALIIMAHVKDGVELAGQYHLGNTIINIIKQHHGTSLITYFYHKAKEQDPNVKEEDFRYPGPKPQTKEAGLVMLADAVEAASRSLVDPSPSRIQNTVQRVISNLFLDGQLDECELTLKDIHKIESMFTKVLIGIFHPRIEYPELPKKGEQGENLDRSRDGKNN